MSRFLADECCPRLLIHELRLRGHDVLYAAETERRTADRDLLDLAMAQDRLLLTEDFDFGELVIREGAPSRGVIVLYLPKLGPEARAQRFVTVLEDASVTLENAVTIVSERRVRQRMISTTSTP